MIDINAILKQIQPTVLDWMAKSGVRSFPTNPVTGQQCFRADVGRLYYYNGETWVDVVAANVSLGYYLLLTGGTLTGQTIVAAGNITLPFYINATGVVGAAGSTYYGARVGLTDTPPAASAHYLKGVYADVRHAGAFNNTGYIRAGDFFAVNNGSSTTTRVTGLFGQAGSTSGTGTITNLFGLDFSLIKAAGTTVVNAYGAQVGWDVLATLQIGMLIAASTAASTNKTALYIDNVSGGVSSNNALVTGTGAVIFGDVLKTKGKKSAVAAKTANYTLTTNDESIVANKATAITLTLPAATGSGQTYKLSNIGVGACTIQANGAETINGSNTQVLYQYETADLVDYGTGVWII